MPPSTFSPRIRIIISRQLGGKRDEGTKSGGASRTASFTVHGVESEEWMMTTMIAYLRYLCHHRTRPFFRCIHLCD